VKVSSVNRGVQQGISLAFGDSDLFLVVGTLQALLGRERDHLPVSGNGSADALEGWQELSHVKV